MRNMSGIMSQMPPLHVLFNENLTSSVFLHSSQKLPDYYPLQLGPYNFNCNGKWKKASQSPLQNFPCSTTRLSRFKFLGSRAFYSSSSVTNNNDESTGLSFIRKDASQHSLLSDCLIPPENEGCPSQEIASLAGGIVALGKFDALHIGHRELAIQAAKIGNPFLLSFIGMAEILGWEPRPPVVAQCDRKRILSSWAPLCGNVIPEEFRIEFSKVRHLSPRQFVEKLAAELGVGGLVAGQNYRFGYRASGDSSDLVRLCNEYGMKASIVDSVMDKNRDLAAIGLFPGSTERGQVSSTQVRRALADGDMAHVSQLLGRNHRLVLTVENDNDLLLHGNTLWAPRARLLNLPPGEGRYRNCSLGIGSENENVVPCGVVIDASTVCLELDESSSQIIFSARKSGLLGIDFGDSKA